MADEDRLLKMAAVAEMTGIPISTLRYWRMEKKGPPSAKVGGRVVYRARDVTAYLDQCFAESAAG